jgi:hypothetical protein
MLGRGNVTLNLGQSELRDLPPGLWLLLKRRGRFIAIGPLSWYKSIVDALKFLQESRRTFRRKRDLVAKWHSHSSSCFSRSFSPTVKLFLR